MAAFGLILALAVPGLVLASHQFPDVPTGHPFHGQIGWMAEKDITDGLTTADTSPANP